MKKVILFATTLLLASLISAPAADAKAAYNKDCAKCHGEDGKGDTKMGKKLKCKDYTDAKVQAAMTDEEMFKAIKEGIKEDGKSKMKAYNNYSDEEIKALVAYCRSFKK